MASTPTMPASTFIDHSEHRVVHSIQVTLRILFGVVPIVAGIDKFTDLLANWNGYLNPLVLRIIPMSDISFMHVVGVIEIIAGALVLTKPRIGAYIVMAWLLAIALQLLAWGHFLDIAVRDIVMALGGALTLARLTPYSSPHSMR